MGEPQIGELRRRRIAIGVNRRQSAAKDGQVASRVRVVKIATFRRKVNGPAQ
jgi:hypothetical protein